MNMHISAIRSARPDPFAPIRLSEQELRRMAAGAPIWHSVDLGDAWIEGQRKTSAHLARELELACLPELSGKTVLDVGAFGGFFSFECARRGASVTAIDYYSWITDFAALQEWISQEKAAGRNPNNYEPPASILDLEGTPGKRVFDAVNAALGNPVASVVTTLEDFAPEARFDVSLYLGVLYHTKDPFGALQKLRDVTSELAIIETLAFHDPDREQVPYWHFHGGDRSVNDDPTTYWSPNAKGLEHMLRQVGFSSVRVINRPAAPGLYRLWAHAHCGAHS